MSKKNGKKAVDGSRMTDDGYLDSKAIIEAAHAAAAGYDEVNHPAHYAMHASGIECIQVTEHMGFCLGNAVKYIWRAGRKGDAVKDLEKARWYLDREIARMTAPARAAGDEMRRIQELNADPAFTLAPCRVRRVPVDAAPKAAKPAAKPKRAYVRKDRLGEPAGVAGPLPEAGAAESPKGEAAAWICPDCGDAYQKTGRNQKRCKECAKAAQRSAYGSYRASLKNPAATADRLAAIKAVDRKLDTIPE